MSGSVVVRPLATEAERQAAVALQEATWGAGFSQRVPESVLWFVDRIGGVAAGAFLPDGLLVGFLFGVTGWVDGAPLHWSDMLAVAREHRGRGIGLALKRWQRETLLAAGVVRAQWTFDPLEAPNAWFNFGRLGCTSSTYLRDVYGSSDSPVHAGLGTDRLVVDWELDAPRVARLAAVDGAEATSLATLPAAVTPFDGSGAPEADVLGVDVPRDIQGLKGADPEGARAWRRRTRRAFEAAFAGGYRVTAFVRDGGGRYLLERAG